MTDIVPQFDELVRLLTTRHGRTPQNLKMACVMLLNEQEAEIERLQAEIKRLQAECDRLRKLVGLYINEIDRLDKERKP